MRLAGSRHNLRSATGERFSGFHPTIATIVPTFPTHAKPSFCQPFSQVVQKPAASPAQVPISNVCGIDQQRSGRRYALARYVQLDQPAVREVRLDDVRWHLAPTETREQEIEPPS